MADVPNGERGRASPLQLFTRIAAQGERVRSLKAGKAPQVRSLWGSLHAHLGQVWGPASREQTAPKTLPPITEVFDCESAFSLIDACGLKKSL